MPGLETGRLGLREFATRMSAEHHPGSDIESRKARKILNALNSLDSNPAGAQLQWLQADRIDNDAADASVRIDLADLLDTACSV